MAPGSYNQLRWLASFGLSLGLLIGLAIWLSIRLPGYRNPPFDFRAMNSRQLFVVDKLTRRQEGSAKVGFAEAYDPPEIGLYGNHIFQFFGRDALEHDNAGYFFNYWYANLALPEIYRYLRHLEGLGRLPKKLILVQITSPNHDNGRFIINFGNELPPDMLLAGNEGNGVVGKTVSIGETAWNVTENWMHQTLNYNTFVLSILQDGVSKRVVDSESCQSAQVGTPQSLSTALPESIQQLLATYGGQYLCRRHALSGAFRGDGSTDPAYAEPRSLVKDEKLLTDAERGLATGDEYEIARLMREIDAIGRRHNIRLTFVIPPVYESDRSGSVVNQIFNRGLALVPDLSIIDDREKHSDPSLFIDYLHPSPKYFRVLVDELRGRGIVSKE
jgi:hypothetical protein